VTLTPQAGQLQTDDIEADQGIVIRECVDVFNRMDLTDEEHCDRCRPLIEQHMIRIREVWLRRLERELVDRIPRFPRRG